MTFTQHICVNALVSRARGLCVQRAATRRYTLMITVIIFGHVTADKGAINFPFFQHRTPAADNARLNGQVLSFLYSRIGRQRTRRRLLHSPRRNLALRLLKTQTQSLCFASSLAGPIEHGMTVHARIRSSGWPVLPVPCHLMLICPSFSRGNLEVALDLY